MQLKQRPIDDNESFDVIKDIEHDKVMTAANKVKAQNDIKKVLHAFDTKKKIQIPKSLNNISINNNINNMSYMFYGCKSLKELNLNNFNIINKIDMK